MYDEKYTDFQNFKTLLTIISIYEKKQLLKKQYLLDYSSWETITAAKN